MARLSDLLSSLFAGLRRKPTPTGAGPGARGGSGGAGGVDIGLLSPGQAGPAATIEVHPGSIGPVRMSYEPLTDGDPDPGEIVWTWVPYEENDGRGKDRPVLVVAVERAGTVLAVQLTSKPHNRDRDFVAIGAGAWDGDHRPSWVRIDRVLRVHAAGMRREAAALARDRYDDVAGVLRERYGWS